MKYLLILLPLFVFSGEYYDLCGGKEYTVSKNKLIQWNTREHNLSDGTAFAVWIRCTKKDMNLTVQPKQRLKFKMNGKDYEIMLHEVGKPFTGNCIDMGKRYYFGKNSSITWTACKKI